MKKIKKMIEFAIALGIGAFLWDKDISASDNIWMMIPMYFIFGLMYYFVKN
jgi:hypothetical protein